MSGRLKAKTFTVKRTDKGSGFQSKFNAFTGGKSIERIHSLDLVSDDEGTKGLLLYEESDGSAGVGGRIYAKVIEGVPHGSGDLQTKINSFSKGKSIEVQGVSTVKEPDGNPLVVILYTKEGGDAEADAESSKSEESVAV